MTHCSVSLPSHSNLNCYMLPSFIWISHKHSNVIPLDNVPIAYTNLWNGF